MPIIVRRPYVDLFLISFLVLFLELACIRWFGSTVVFLTFFTNFVLMACFLGVSVGCLAVATRRAFIEAVLPLILFTMVLAFGLLWSYSRFSALKVGVDQQNSPELIYFGTETPKQDLSQFVIPLELIAGVFFGLVSLIFIGLGQTMGRAFNAIADPIRSYTVNLLGSLVGIVGFAALALLRTPPSVWFGLSAAIVLYFIKRRSMRLVSAGAAVLIVGGLILTVDLPAAGEGTQALTIWSPYYKIRLEPANGVLSVNNIRHQAMENLQTRGAFYHLPYSMNFSAGQPPFEEVLIIGAGSGNDVAAALAWGAKHIDAVEIDPVLHEIGRQYHPNRPALDPRVTYHIDDGRSFVRSTRKKYDLIVYALVDSLVLHSGYSSIRLESFLFTEQAFRDLESRLKPGGVFVMYNFYRLGWVVGRVAKLAEQVFGTKPIVLSVPYHQTITPRDEEGLGLNFIIAGSEQSRSLQAIRTRLRENGFFWLHRAPAANRWRNAFRASAQDLSSTQPEEWYKLGPAQVETEGIGRLPTDDFPFLYLRDPMVPGLNLRGMLIVAALSLAILFCFAPVRNTRPNGQMFFLGAGFMLLETKGVVHMALLFGSTWSVNSIVFAAILLMALLSNLYVLVIKPQRLWPYYALLIASLLVNLAVPMTSYLALPGVTKIVLSCTVVFVPVFFAGVVFAALFRASRRPNLDFGSNIGGAILGGLSENLSLVLGFSNLLIIAVIYYALSAVLAPRSRG